MTSTQTLMPIGEGVEPLDLLLQLRTPALGTFSLCTPQRPNRISTSAPFARRGDPKSTPQLSERTREHVPGSAKTVENRTVLLEGNSDEIWDFVTLVSKPLRDPLALSLVLLSGWLWLLHGARRSRHDRRVNTSLAPSCTNERYLPSRRTSLDDLHGRARR